MKKYYEYLSISLVFLLTGCDLFFLPPHSLKRNEMYYPDSSPIGIYYSCDVFPAAYKSVDAVIPGQTGSDLGQLWGPTLPYPEWQRMDDFLDTDSEYLCLVWTWDTEVYGKYEYAYSVNIDAVRNIAGDYYYLLQSGYYFTEGSTNNVDESFLNLINSEYDGLEYDYTVTAEVQSQYMVLFTIMRKIPDEW